MDRLSRDAKWNLAFVTFVVVGAAAAAFLGGASRSMVATVLAGYMVAGTISCVLAVSAWRRRDPWQRFLREQPVESAVEPRRALPIRAAREEA